MAGRSTKQFLFGTIYVVLIFLILYAFYGVFIRSSPTCFDNKQNGSETGVDCGGSSCVACEIKNLANIRISSVTPIPGADADLTTLLVEFQNPNQNYGATVFEYTLNLYGKTGTSTIYSSPQTAFIYPGEIKQRLMLNIPVAFSSVVRGEGVLTSITWESRTLFSAPKLETREIKVDLQPERGRVVITGVLRNDNTFSIRRANVSAVFSDSTGKPILASQTVVDNLGPFEERFFQITALAKNASSLKTPRISVEAER